MRRTHDAVADITQTFVYKVLPDLLGVQQQGRRTCPTRQHVLTMADERAVPRDDARHAAMVFKG
jgi:hypothetical protein